MLALDVAFVFDVVSDLQSDLWSHVPQSGKLGNQVGPIHFRPPQDFGQRDIVDFKLLQLRGHRGDGRFLDLQSLPTRCIGQADLVGHRRQAAIGVVLTQQQPMLGATGEHSIRFIHPTSH